MKKIGYFFTAFIIVLAGCSTTQKSSNNFQYKQEINVDDFTGIKTYSSQFNMIHSGETDGKYFLDILNTKENGERTNQFMLSYYGEDYIQLKENPLKFLIDGEVIETQLGKTKSKRVNSNRVLEAGFYPIEMEKMGEISRSDSVKIRVPGSMNHDFWIPDSALNRINNLYNKIKEK